MPLLLADAQLLSNNELVRGVVEEIVDVDDLFRVLPFARTEGKAYVYNREGTLADAQFILPNVNTPESATSFTEVTVTLKILVGDVDVDNFLNAVMSDTNDQRAVQIAHKAKALARKFSNALISGDSTKVYDLTALGGASGQTNVEFDGLDRLCTSGHVLTSGGVGGNGSALVFDNLDKLIDTVRIGPDAFIMGRRTIRDYKKLLRSLSRVDPEFIELDGGRKVMAYSGLPILLNDFISEAQTVGTSTDCSTIYCAKFDEVNGVHGIYGGDNLGISIIDIGQLQGRDASRTRLRWYVSMAMKSTLSLARLVGVRTSTASS